MKLNRRDLCYAEGEPDRKSFLFCWRAFSTRRACGYSHARCFERTYTYSRMLHLLAARFPFVFFPLFYLFNVRSLARPWLVDNARDLQALAERCKRLATLAKSSESYRDFVPSREYASFTAFLPRRLKQTDWHKYSNVFNTDCP